METKSEPDRCYDIIRCMPIADCRLTPRTASTLGPSIEVVEGIAEPSVRKEAARGMASADRSQRNVYSLRKVHLPYLLG